MWGGAASPDVLRTPRVGPVFARRGCYNEAMGSEVDSAMRPAVRWTLALGASLAAFVVLAWPCGVAHLWVWRESLRLAEFVGIMDPGGALGGQILGHNSQREPAWVHGVAAGVGALLAYTPALAVAILVLHMAAGRRTPRPTLCGGCGSVLRGLTEARCPKCGRGF